MKGAMFVASLHKAVQPTWNISLTLVQVMITHG
jgi:hypothetical protein